MAKGKKAPVSKLKVTVLIIAFAVIAVLSVNILQQVNKSAIDPVASRAKGSAEAKVKIVEFIDFQCPACAKGAMVLKQYLANYPQDIYLQLRYFPLTQIHRHALQSALYGECAARQGRFWDIHYPMMEGQQQWSALLSADPIFNTMAKEAGIDMEKLNQCLASEEARKAVNDDRSLGQSMGVQSTPSYFVNDKMVVGSKSLIEELNKYFPPATVEPAASGQ